MALFGKKDKAKRERALRIFFASDVHGSERCFRKFLAAGTVYEADAIIMGGDFAGKGLVPIAREDGKLHARVRGDEVVVAEEEYDALEAEINRYGYYAREMTRDEVDAARGDPETVDGLFRDEIARQLNRWSDLAAERLPDHVRCFVTPGNDDPGEMDKVLAKSTRIECPSMGWTDLGPTSMVSLAFTPPTPWDTERELPEERLTELIATMMRDGPADRPVIMNFHCPPYGSGLDNAPELDTTLRPVIRGGRPSFIPVGSTAVREAIKTYQPVLGLHGHIHESRAVQKIGRTLCVNPGSDYTADVLRGVVVDLADDGSVLDFLLTAG